MRLPSKDVREVAQLLRDLGYHLARYSSGHLVYTHAEQPELILSGTPSDWRWQANMMAELRRRHPGHVALQRVAKSGVGKRRRRRSRAPRLPVSLRIARSELPVASADASPLLAEVAPPGSPDAVAAGCWCPVFENRKGLGLDERDGVFAYVVGCPVHPDASEEAA